jgi:phosphoribosylformylglycinamidine cyclo-ligase
MKQSAYARAGVDIQLGNRMKATLPRLLASATRPEVLGKVGGFGGLFDLNRRRYRRPVLVSSVDGVGTKLKIAFAMDRHDTIGQDLVNHCVNDIAVLGAEPLFFLDYLGTGRLQPRVFSEVLRGFAKACAENGCALVGGETAQLPDFYQPGEYDVSGTIVGVVERDRILDGSAIQSGDLLIGIASSGLHTNGYSLARRVLFDQMKLKLSSRPSDLAGSVGEELMKVHVSYGPLIRRLLRKFNPPRRSPALKGLAHITGGGFVDNLPRVLPKSHNAVIRRGTWPVPPIFKIMAEGGRVGDGEMHQVFNMGIGMVCVVQNTQAKAVLRSIRASGHPAWIIGEIVSGRGRVVLD